MINHGYLAVYFFFLLSGFVIGYAMISNTSIWMLLIIMVIGFTMLPLPPSIDIRGWQEMHPLNGPAWSLFFEYIVKCIDKV